MTSENEFQKSYHQLENLVSSIGMGINYVKKCNDDHHSKLEIIEKIKERIVVLNNELGHLKDLYFHQQ